MLKLKIGIFTFMAIEILTFVLNVIGIIVFRNTRLYIYHPVGYLLMAIGGLGWTCTAIASYFDARKRTNGFKL